MIRMRAIWLMGVTLTLGGCDLLTPKPKDMAAQPVPPPASGVPQLFADGEMVSLQVRPGNCAEAQCQVFRDGRWHPMPKAALRSLPILAVSEPTGSEYSDGLWRSVAPGRAVLVNSSAAGQSQMDGHLDGLRIGLSDSGRRTYVTAYSLEDAKAVPAGTGHALGDGRIFARVDAEVVVHGGKAWLLHRRPDRSGNLIDLFAILARPGPYRCLPGLVLDTSQWAGPAEKALSPNLFVSRDIDVTKDAARRQAVIAACPAKPANPSLKERLRL